MSRIKITNARIVDPASGIDRAGQLHIDGNAIVALDATPDGFTAEKTIDAGGLIVCPGFVDLYARLREPGFEKKASIRSESRAALHGGITTIVCSPDTDPVIDEEATVELIHRRASDAGYSRVHPLAALTRQLDGVHLSELATLTAAGCVGASNADLPIINTLVIRRAMEYARTFNVVLMFAPVDAWLRGNGCAHEGRVATRLGLPGIPVAAETVALGVLLELTRQTGARVHFSRITSARGAELIAEAKSRGLPVTADTSIAHLFFTEESVDGFDAMFRSVAPFRSQQDRLGLRAALVDGTLDAICTDHAPHEPDAKLAPFPSAEPGLSTLDAYLPMLLQFGREESLPLTRTLNFATDGAARCLHLRAGKLSVGAAADLILFDAQQSFTLDGSAFHSAGKNSPFLGKQLLGRTKYAVVDGRWFDLGTS